MTGRLIEIFLPDSDIPAYRQGRIANRSVRAITVNRSELNRFSGDEEGNGGLYILVDEDEQSGIGLYVGRSENVAKRLAEHNRGSNVADADGAPFDFSIALVFLGDDWQTVAHRMWLEAKLIDAMRSVSWVTVLNKNQERAPSLNPSQAAVVSEVLDDIRLLMPILGLDVLERVVPRGRVLSARTPIEAISSEEREGASFQLDFAGVHAEILVIGDRYVALAGSEFARAATEALQLSYKNLRQRLVDEGKVDQSSGVPKLKEDVEFRSASAIGSVLTGQPLQALNRITHKESGQTLRDWLASQTPGS